MSGPLRLQSGFALMYAVQQPPLVVFWVCHSAVMLTTDNMRSRSSHNNHIITRDCSWSTWCYMLYSCVSAWLPVCSVLNSGKLLRCAPASVKIEVLHICSRGLLTSRAGTVKIRSTVDLVEVNIYRLEWNLSAPPAWWGRNAEEVCFTIARSKWNPRLPCSEQL